MSESTHQPSPPGTLDVRVDAPASVGVASSTPESNGRGAANGQAPIRHEFNRLRGPRRKWMIIAGITATALITALSVSLLYYKWYRSVEFNSMIIAYDPANEGATVRVTDNAGGIDLSARLEKANNNVIRFHVPRGSYTVTVSRAGAGTGPDVVLRRVSITYLPEHSQWWALDEQLDAPPKRRDGAK